MSNPSVGRIVHYVSRGSADGVFGVTCRAAVVTDVDGDSCDLAVLNPDGALFARGIPYADAGPVGPQSGNGGTWHWPERA